MCDIACDIVLDRLAEIKDIFLKEVEKFRTKGAVTPENAMSIEELGLSPRFKKLLIRSPRMLGVFKRVGDKYYLSENRLREIERKLSARPFQHLLRHTASVPKGLLRFYVFKLLKEKPMSGSEIMEEIEKQTGGLWKPSPGSVYPLLTWIRENGYAEELPREVTGIKRYMLTEKGTKFLEKHRNFEDRLQKKMAPMGPLFFLPMNLDADELKRLQESINRFFAAFFDLRFILKDNLTEQSLEEVEQLLNDVSERIEELNEKLRS